MNVSTFRPPTPEQFEQYLQRYSPQPPSAWEARLPILGIGVVLLLVVIFDGLALLLPWLVLIGLLIYFSVRAKRAKAIEQQAVRIHELAMLRKYPQALRDAWRLLPALTKHPTLYVRTVAMMAHCLDQLRAHDAAIVGYDQLLGHLPDEHPGSVQLRIQRAIAALFADRLTDADDALRRVRNIIGPYAGTPVAALYRLAVLIQDVYTHHYTDAVEQAGDIADALRPLGVEAGFGHALMALCYQQDRAADDPDAQRQAQTRWWKQATTLIPEAALIERFPQLASLKEAA